MYKKTIILCSFLGVLVCSTTTATIKPKMTYKAKVKSVLFKQYTWMNKYYFDLIYTKSKKYQLNPFLTAAVIQAESTGKQYATGKRVVVCVKAIGRKCLKRKATRARGLMQVLPVFYHKNKPVKTLYLPHINIEKGTRILSFCQRKARGNLTVTLKNYNSGHNSSYYNRPYI
ncbi:MAG: transglycosylase SLT domain-containing protein, partial [Phycisphaerales bacterium]|nr:transglycosylase SLT domain-containing protein [Phycisphaerales bacterium]